MIDIANQFKIESAAEVVEEYGAGHINQTYLVICRNKTKYILQKINHKTFPNVDELMKNICGVTQYIAKSNEGDPTAENLLVVPTLQGNSYLYFNEGYYRMYTFLSGQTVDTGATLKQFELAGRAFGQFQLLLDGYPAENLFEPIKDFHNTVQRFRNLEKAIEQDVCGRVAQCGQEIQFYHDRQSYCSKVLDMISNGEMPLRVTHNDTKPNNVLVDEEHDKVVGVIDLDTIMPGSILYDFGDSIRYGANTAVEDERDLSKVSFSQQYYEAYCRGFLPEVKDRLTQCEKDNMYFGAMLMTYECGMRFLTDHLNGDTYFRIHRENHNLDRCHTQMKLLQDMENNIEVMKNIAKKYL